MAGMGEGIICVLVVLVAAEGAICAMGLIPFGFNEAVIEREHVTAFQPLKDALGPRFEIWGEFNDAVDGRRRHVAQEGEGGIVERFRGERELSVGGGDTVFGPLSGPAEASDGKGVWEFVGQVDTGPGGKVG